jgi:hypothetical protein
MANLNTGLSVSFEIGGQTVPLQTGPLADGPELIDAIREAFEDGLDFSLPSGHSVDVALSELLSWLTDKGLSPPDLSSIVDGIDITISGLTISSSGKFNIVLRVQFKPDIIPDSLPFGELVDVTELGLRLTYDPDAGDPGETPQRQVRHSLLAPGSWKPLERSRSPCRPPEVRLDAQNRHPYRRHRAPCAVL